MTLAQGLILFPETVSPFVYHSSFHSSVGNYIYSVSWALVSSSFSTILKFIIFMKSLSLYHFSYIKHWTYSI